MSLELKSYDDGVCQRLNNQAKIQYPVSIFSSYFITDYSIYSTADNFRSSGRIRFFFRRSIYNSNYYY